MNKGVSVIIPCHYDWVYVDECLDSVFQQKNVDTQVICVYNAQNVHSPLFKELTKLQNRHIITLIDNGNDNYGAAFARNRGLERVKDDERVRKDTVMFIDDDDIIGWKPGQSDIDHYYLDYFYDVLAADNKLAMVTGDIIDSRAGLENINFKNYSELPKKSPVKYEHAFKFLDNRNTSCATLYRTNIINDNNLRFKTHMKYREDTEFIMQYALTAATKYDTYIHALKPVKWPDSDEGLTSYYWYRKHLDSVMGQTSQNSLNKWYNEYQKQKDNLGYRAYLLEALEPVQTQFPQTYQKMLTEWKHTQEEIAQDLHVMEKWPQINVSYDMLMWYKLLTFFDVPKEDVVNAAKAYLSFYTPEHTKNEVYRDAIMKLFAFMLHSDETKTLDEIKAQFRQTCRF